MRIDKLLQHLAQPQDDSRGAVLIELAIGVIILLSATFGLLTVSQGVREANLYLDASRYAARMSAAPLIPPPPMGPGAPEMTYDFGATASQAGVVQAQARAFVLQFLGDVDESKYNIGTEVVSVVEGAETFWVVRVSVGAAQPTTLSAFSPSVQAAATSAFLLAGVRQDV